MRAALFAALLLAGCYDPHPPSGAYLCGAPIKDGGVGSCPDNQLCECGQCVDKAGEAACSFTIMVPALDGGVSEHEPFDVTVTAYASADGGVAKSFTGDVTLSSTWGDVCVGTAGCIGSPNTVRLVNGTVAAKVQLNRETISPQTAVLRASFAGNTGTSGSARISVSAPRFGAPSTIQAPLYGTNGSFGFAKSFVGAPFVVRAKAGWNLYFLGADGASSAIGVATSSDGLTFQAPAAPLYIDPSNGIGPPSALLSGDDITLIFGSGAHSLSTSATSFGYDQISALSGPQSSTPLAGQPSAVLAASSCPFCAAFDTPSIIADPNPSLSGGGPNATIMYFTALPNVQDTTTLTVGRATSPDGKTYTVDPSALIKTTTEENAIYSPHVLVDGTTYKMWYSVTSYGNVADAAPPSPCEVDGDDPLPLKVSPTIKNVYTVGYATSSDGLFWVRSPTNESDPVFAYNVGGTYKSALVSSVLPVDGSDPSSGIALYFSPFSKTLLSCLPDGMFRTQTQ